MVLQFHEGLHQPAAIRQAAGHRALPDVLWGIHAQHAALLGRLWPGVCGASVLLWHVHAAQAAQGRQRGDGLGQGALS